MKFVEFNVEMNYTSFLSYRDKKNENEVTAIKFDNINNEPPIQLLHFTAEKVIFKVLKECHTTEWGYQEMLLKPGDIVYGYPDTRIEIVARNM